MDWERLRKLFGREGDVNKSLERMFGGAYMDHPDDSKENIPDALNTPDAANVLGLVDRAIRGAKEINCQTCQSIQLRDLVGYMDDTGIISWEEGWQIERHLQEGGCSNPKCFYLHRISHLTKWMTPGDVRASHGSELRNWEIS